MSVWISDEKLLIFASLISSSKMILFEKKYQTFDTVFHHQMKHLEVRQKYSAARRIFNSLLGVSSGDETLHLMFDILHETTACKRTMCKAPIFNVLRKYIIQGAWNLIYYSREKNAHMCIFIFYIDFSYVSGHYVNMILGITLKYSFWLQFCIYKQLIIE